jgi:NAD(P)-dependent dehydrogenase (short-subunit alcohol dehydrogenase family)
MAWFKPLNPPQADWRGKSVWVIGASSGIGRATASMLHALGAHVTVSARHGAALEAFVQAHPGSRALVLDCTDRAAVHEAARVVAGVHVGGGDSVDLSRWAEVAGIENSGLERHALEA